MVAGKWNNYPDWCHPDTAAHCRVATSLAVIWGSNKFSVAKIGIIMGPILISTKQDVSGSLEHMETDGVCRLEEHDVHPSIEDMVTSRQTDSTQDMANWRGML